MFHGNGALLIVVRHAVDPSAHGIAPHQPSVEGLQQFGRRGHIRHPRIEPNVVAVRIGNHWHSVVDGQPYEMYDFGEIKQRVLSCMNRLQSANAVLLRGVGALLKAQMAWTHGEFADAACIYLWIALDAAHSQTLQKLRESGVQNPTSKDASLYLNSVIGFETPWEKFFEEDYENRIRAIHPDNRIGAEIRPQLLADDFYELRHLLIPYFEYLVTGTYLDPDKAG